MWHTAWTPNKAHEIVFPGIRVDDPTRYGFFKYDIYETKLDSSRGLFSVKF